MHFGLFEPDVRHFRLTAGSLCLQLSNCIKEARHSTEVVLVLPTVRTIENWNQLSELISFEPFAPQKSYAQFWKAETFSFPKLD